MNNKIIYIAGPDGIGKTTHLRHINQVVANKKTRHIWIRSPKIISKPLMGYCRLVGLTKYKLIDGVRYGTHDFYKSAIVSWLFPVLQLIDFKIKWKIEKRKITNNDVLLFDRFNLDTLADLMVDTHNMSLHKTWIGKSFIKILPHNSKVVILEVDEKVIRYRKKDTLFDENLELKLKVYKILSRDLNIRVIDNNRDFNIVNKELIKYLSNE